MSLLSNPAEQIIVALDGMTTADSLLLIDSIPKLCWVKVGLELFITAGPDLLNVLQKEGKKVFLDLKFHDIPSTMAKACRQAAKTGAKLITVHACAGRAALFEANRAAIEGAKDLNLPPPTLLAVTVLTSWKPENFAKELCIKQSLDQRVELMADLASQAGIGGCVCSAVEVEKLRQLYPHPFQLITPGIRPKGSNLDDQARVMSASEAINAGASKLVIGRAITRSENPSEAFQYFCRELTAF